MPSKKLIGFMICFVAATASVVEKRREGWPRLFFLAGLEGTGHHLVCQALEPRCEKEDAPHDQSCFWFAKKLEDVVKAHILTNAKEAAMTSLRIRERLKTIVEDNGSRMSLFHFQCNERLDGGGFKCSYPDAGLATELKSHLEGKVDSHLDLSFLAEACEAAGIDLRIVLVTRDPVDSVYSTALHRFFGSVEQETRILLSNLQILSTQLDAIDPKFFCSIDYDDLVDSPRETSEHIAKFIGLTSNHMSDSFASKVFPNRTRREVDPFIRSYVEDAFAPYVSKLARRRCSEL